VYEKFYDICLVDDWGESKGCKVNYSRNAKARKAFIDYKYYFII